MRLTIDGYSTNSDIRTTAGSYIAQLRNVPEGALCKHTGLRRGHVPTKWNDKGVVFTNYGSHQQTLDGKDVIFGVFDLVEVLVK